MYTGGQLLTKLRSKQTKKRHKIITACYIFAHLQPLFPTIMFIKEPFNIRYWPIRFKEVYANNLVLKCVAVLVGGFLDIIASIFAVFPIGLVVSMLMIYFAKLKLWLVQISNNMRVFGASESSLQKYRIVELVNKFGLCCLSAEILPIFYTGIHACSTITLATLFQRTSEVSFEVQLNCSLSFIVIMLAVHSLIIGAGETVTISQNMKHKFIDAPTKFLRKRMVACRDIRVYFNSVFFIEKGTFTVFVDSVINNTITFMLAN